MGSRLRRWIFRTGCAGLLWLVLATVAAAHAALTGSQPADGALLAAAPDDLTLSFGEPVSPLVLTLVRPDGGKAGLAAVESGETLTIVLPQDLGQGTHLVLWRVVSADGHPVGGRLAFSIGKASPLPVASGVDSQQLVAGGLWVTKLALYAAIFFGIGSAFAAVWFPAFTMPGRRIALALTASGLIATVPAAGFQGLDALGSPLSGLVNPLVWQAAFETSFARSLLLLAAAFLLAATGLYLKNRRMGFMLSLAALSAAAAALAATGHAGAAQPQWLMRTAVFLHAFTIALWLGALIPLGLSLYRGHAGTGEALRRFSAFIPAALVVLLFSGIVLAVVQVREPAGLLHTDYGRLLVVKLGLVGVVLVFAAFNRWGLTRPARGGDAGATASLAQIIALETVLLAVILGVAAGWRFTPPPRVLAIAAAEPVSVHAQSAKAIADVTVAPGQAGPVAVSAIVMTEDYGPLDASSVRFILSRPDRRADPVVAVAAKPGDGTWAATDIDLPLPGTWSLRLEITIGETPPVLLEDRFELKRSPFR